MYRRCAGIIQAKLGYEIGSRADNTNAEGTGCLHALQRGLGCHAEFCGNERLTDGFRGFEFTEENPLLSAQRHVGIPESTRNPRRSQNIDIDGGCGDGIFLNHVA